jgi:hypothetical protein
MGIKCCVGHLKYVYNSIKISDPEDLLEIFREILGGPVAAKYESLLPSPEQHSSGAMFSAATSIVAISILYVEAGGSMNWCDVTANLFSCIERIDCVTLTLKEAAHAKTHVGAMASQLDALKVASSQHGADLVVLKADVGNLWDAMHAQKALLDEKVADLDGRLGTAEEEQAFTTFRVDGMENRLDDTEAAVVSVQGDVLALSARVEELGQRVAGSEATAAGHVGTAANFAAVASQAALTAELNSERASGAVATAFNALEDVQDLVALNQESAAEVRAGLADVQALLPAVRAAPMAAANLAARTATTGLAQDLSTKTNGIILRAETHAGEARVSAAAAASTARRVNEQCSVAVKSARVVSGAAATVAGVADAVAAVADTIATDAASAATPAAAATTAAVAAKAALWLQLEQRCAQTRLGRDSSASAAKAAAEIFDMEESFLALQQKKTKAACAAALNLRVQAEQKACLYNVAKCTFRCAEYADKPEKLRECQAKLADAEALLSAALPPLTPNSGAALVPGNLDGADSGAVAPRWLDMEQLEATVRAPAPSDRCRGVAMQLAVSPAAAVPAYEA